MRVRLSAKYCIYFFNVDQINQWCLSDNEASRHPIYFKQIERAGKKATLNLTLFLIMLILSLILFLLTCNCSVTSISMVMQNKEEFPKYGQNLWEIYRKI